jgi:hypothetical protein
MEGTYTPPKYWLTSHLCFIFPHQTAYRTTAPSSPPTNYAPRLHFGLPRGGRQRRRPDVPERGHPPRAERLSLPGHPERSPS